MKPLLQRVILGVVATVALAFAAGVCVVAAACGLYALLRIGLSPAASAGLTALAAAIVAAVIALVLTRLKGPGRPASKPAGPSRIDPETLQTAAVVGTAIAGMAADFALQHRAERKRSKRDKRGSRRR